MNTAPLQPLFLLRPGIRLVLASASPRRRQFMDEWGLPYTIVRPTGVEPRPEHGETPAAYALRAATAKARAVAASADAGADDLILAADTVVALGHDILGKPADDADALDMLRRLSGREHEVITGVCAFSPTGAVRALPIPAPSASMPGLKTFSAPMCAAANRPTRRGLRHPGPGGLSGGKRARFLVHGGGPAGEPRLAALLLEGGWMRPVD